MYGKCKLTRYDFQNIKVNLQESSNSVLTQLLRRYQPLPACAECSAGPASSAPTPAASARAASYTTSSAAFCPVCQSSCWGRTPGRSTGLRAETWRTWWVLTLHKSSPTEGDRAVFRWCRGAAPAAPLCRRLSRFRSRRERSPPGKWSAPKKQNDRNDLNFG